MASPGLRDRPSSDPADDQQDRSDRLSISRDDAFHLLQNGRRRAVLRYLLEHEDVEEVRLGDVTERIAAWDQGTTTGKLDPDHRQRIYVSLYQSHLPTLDEHDVVEFDRSRRTISLRRLAYALSPFLGDGLYAPQTIHLEGAEPGGTATGAVDQFLSKLGLATR